MLKITHRLLAFTLCFSYSFNVLAGQGNGKLAVPVEEEEVELLTPLGRRPSLTPLTFNNPEDPQRESVFFQHSDVRKHIFYLLDYKTTLAALRVCQLWRREINMNRDQLLKNLNVGIPKNMFPYFFHPLTMCTLFDAVSTHTPLEVIEYADADADTETPKAIVEVPEVVQDFVELAGRSIEGKTLLSRTVLSLDPAVDYRRVCLMSRIVKTDPSYLQDLTESDTFPEVIRNPGVFPAVIKSPTNHPILQKYLMSLKLLALAGDEEAKAKLSEIALSNINVVNGHILPNGLKRTLKEYPDQPLWVCYTDS